MWASLVRESLWKCSENRQQSECEKICSNTKKTSGRRTNGRTIHHIRGLSCPNSWNRHITSYQDVCKRPKTPKQLPQLIVGLHGLITAISLVATESVLMPFSLFRITLAHVVAQKPCYWIIISPVLFKQLRWLPVLLAKKLQNCYDCIRTCNTTK